MGELIRNTWDAARCREASDNYNAVMGRTWYGIAGSSGSHAGQDVFWEHNSWKPGQEGRRFDNHTITRNVGKAINDFGIWPGYITKNDLFALRPVIKVLGFRIPMPMKMEMHWLSFPKGDAKDQVWTYYGNLPFGKRVFFMFALTPHISAEVYEAELARLKEENGVETPFHRVAWSESYKPGDTDEHKIN